MGDTRLYTIEIHASAEGLRGLAESIQRITDEIVEYNELGEGFGPPVEKVETFDEIDISYAYTLRHETEQEIDARTTNVAN